MKDYQRIITHPIQFVSTDHFEIHQELNEHARLAYCGVIEDQNEEDYLDLFHQDTWMMVEAEDREGKRQTLFYGLITAYTMEHIGTDTVLSIECMSGTCLLDIKPHLRTFQNEQKTYADILSCIHQEYQNAAVIIGRQGEGTVGENIVQYQETDWEFLKRLSSRMGSFLTAACYVKGSKYYWGMPDLEKRAADPLKKYRIVKHMDEQMKKEGAGVRLSVQDSLSYIIEEREIYQIGEHIHLFHRDLCIYRIETRYLGGECIHTYYLRTLRGLTQPRSLAHHMTGVSLRAKVTAVKQDVVQVKVQGDEHLAQGNTRWFPYSTVYSSEDGTGFYCMPEIGDEVRLHLPSAKEEEAYVISAVYLKHEVSRQNPDHKSLKNKYGKEILFTPDSLVLTNNQGLRIELLDQKGILIQSDKAVRISSEGEIIVSSEKSSVTLAATDQVLVQQGGTSLVLNRDISFVGGEFRMQ